MQPAAAQQPVAPGIETLAVNLRTPGWLQDYKRGLKQSCLVCSCVFVLVCGLGHVPMLQSAGLLPTARQAGACNVTAVFNASCCWLSSSNSTALVVGNRSAMTDPAATRPNSTRSDTLNNSAANDPAAGPTSSTGAQTSTINVAGGPAAGLANSTADKPSNSSAADAPAASPISNSTSAQASNVSTPRDPAADSVSSNAVPPGNVSAGVTGLAALIRNVTEPIVSSAQTVEAIAGIVRHAATSVGQAVSALNATSNVVLPASRQARAVDWLASAARALGFGCLQRAALCMFLLLFHHLAWYLLLSALVRRQHRFAFDARDRVVSIFWWARSLDNVSSFLALTTLCLLIISSQVPAAQLVSPWHVFDLCVCICHVVVFLCFFSMQYNILHAFAPARERLLQDVQLFFDEEAGRAKAATFLFLGGAVVFWLIGSGVAVDAYTCSLLNLWTARTRAGWSCVLLAASAAVSWGFARHNARSAVRPTPVADLDGLPDRRRRFCAAWTLHTIMGYITMSMHAAYNLVLFVVQNQKIVVVPAYPYLLYVADCCYLVVALLMFVARIALGIWTRNRVAAFNPALDAELGAAQDAAQDAGQGWQLQSVLQRFVDFFSWQRGGPGIDLAAHPHVA